jgi:hypothetical protein
MKNWYSVLKVDVITGKIVENLYQCGNKRVAIKYAKLAMKAEKAEFDFYVGVEQF